MFVCMDVSIYVCIYLFIYVCMGTHTHIHKPPKKFLSYLNSMLKTNIDKNKNFNKKHVSPPIIIYN